MTQAEALFQPANLGKLQVKNRIVMAPMTRTFSPGNIPNDKVVDYYRRRAEGGVGLIITEGTCVDHIAASGYPNVPSFYGEEALAGWKKVVMRCMRRVAKSPHSFGTWARSVVLA